MKKKKLILLALIISLLAIGAGCAKQNIPTTIDYYVPKNIAAYMQAEEAYSQTLQGADPALTVEYVKNTTPINSAESKMLTAAQAAVVLLPAGGGPAHANIVYLKLVGTTAYVMLDIDFNGWAGVSAVKAAIKPVIEKNILQFPEVKNVVFGPAPGDTKKN